MSGAAVVLLSGGLDSGVAARKPGNVAPSTTSAKATAGDALGPPGATIAGVGNGPSPGVSDGVGSSCSNWRVRQTRPSLSRASSVDHSVGANGAKPARIGRLNVASTE